MVTLSGRPKKDPENVRRRLLNSTASLVARRGFSGVSVSEIASEAGVTKGGLFHHFGSKQELITAVFDEELDRFNGQVDLFLAEDTCGYGFFTRAYIKATFSAFTDQTSALALTYSLCAEPELILRWENWLAQRLTQHQDTDTSPVLEIARFAADGIWFSNLLKDVTQHNQEHLKALQQRLLEMTYENCGEAF